MLISLCHVTFGAKYSLDIIIIPHHTRFMYSCIVIVYGADEVISTDHHVTLIIA